MWDLKEFKQLIHEYLIIFDQLIHIEGKKLDFISSNDVELLESQMKEEQAYILKLKGLDMKREKLQEDMKLGGLSFSEIINTLHGENKEELNSAYKALIQKTEELKSATNSTKQYIELRLHSIKLLISKLGGEKELEALYDKSGAHAVSNVSQFASKKV